jgi:TRAP-type transport system periplasmic protein
MRLPMQLLVAAAGCWLALSSAVAAEPRVLKAGIGLAPESAQGKALQRFAQTVKERSGGMLIIDAHASGKLGNDVDMVSALRAGTGTVDITVPDSSTLAKYVNDFSAINYPFTFLNESEADTLLDGEWGAKLLSKLPSNDLIGITYWENGFRHLTNSKQAINSFRDTAGVKVRVMQNQMLLDSFKTMGFEAVAMPFGAVYGALQKKEVDAQENPLMTILTSKFYEVQNHLTLSRHVYSAYVFLVGKKTWEKLSDAERKIITEAAIDARDYQRKTNREMNANALEQLKAKGMQVTQIDLREAESVRRRLRDVLDRYNRVIGEATVISMYVTLSQMRANRIAAPLTTTMVTTPPPAKAAVPAPAAPRRVATSGG